MFCNPPPRTDPTSHIGRIGLRTSDPRESLCASRERCRPRAPRRSGWSCRSPGTATCREPPWQPRRAKGRIARIFWLKQLFPQIWNFNPLEIWDIYLKITCLILCLRRNWCWCSRLVSLVQSCFSIANILSNRFDSILSGKCILH